LPQRSSIAKDDYACSNAIVIPDERYEQINFRQVAGAWHPLSVA